MDIFTTALGLSKQQSGFDLARYLVQRLEQDFNPKDVDVFEVFGIPGNYSIEDIPDSQNITVRRFNYDNTTKRKKSDLTEFHEAIKNRRPLIVNSNGSTTERIVMPVMSESGPLRLVVISGISESQDERTLLFQSVELFSSLVNLHDSHERDQLTGMMNRQTFDEFFNRILNIHQIEEQKMYLGMCDIDHFRKINDAHGHDTGDRVLLDLAHIMEDNFRFNDALFRFGGEEFIVLFRCRPKDASVVLNRFRESVQSHGQKQNNDLTLSIGYVECRKHEIPSTVIGKADIALYHAKENGRNQVVDYDNIQMDSATG
jgi:diguanylate cyclase (GGDEF)-like protein